ncbi:MAG: hypothetical protein ACRCX8_12460 [Sarcina sp.]
MCKKCEKLINVPKDKKAWTVIDEDIPYGAKLSKTIMEVNHEDDGTRYAFISHDTVLENYRNYGTVIDIKYCPFCGKKLCD